MTSGLKTFIYPVKDLAQAQTLYRTLLGIEPSMDEVYYVHFNLADQEIGLDPNGHSKGMTGPVGYWHVEDIKDSVARLLAAGATEHGSGVSLGSKMLRSWEDCTLMVNSMGLRCRFDN